MKKGGQARSLDRPSPGLRNREGNGDDEAHKGSSCFHHDSSPFGVSSGRLQGIQNGTVYQLVRRFPRNYCSESPRLGVISPMHAAPTIAVRQPPPVRAEPCLPPRPALRAPELILRLLLATGRPSLHRPCTGLCSPVRIGSRRALVGQAFFTERSDVERASCSERPHHPQPEPRRTVPGRTGPAPSGCSRVIPL